MKTSLHYRVRYLVCALLLALLLLIPPPALAAHTPVATDDQDAAPVSLMIELSEPAAAEVYVATLTDLAVSAEAAASDNALAEQLAAATRAQLSTNLAAQDALLSPLAELGAQVIFQVQRVYNGVAVHVPADRANELLSLPGVSAIHPLIAKQPANARSVPFVGAPALWQAPNVKATGLGVRIAIIDTGVDYLHAAFGGPATGYQGNDVTKIGDTPYFPSQKVVGGYDFSGNNYNADPEDSDYQPIPAPDPDPMDCYAHGTHVAATAAGYGVTSDGLTYPGPFSASTNFAALRIGPGVAPEAQIYALKVFGCTGSSELVDQAIEWSVDPNGDGDFADRVDVINMSLGSTYGGANDSTSVAADRAAQLGVIVVASAGNSGDTYYATGSPGSATQVISVAATRLAEGAAFSAPDSSQADTVADFSSRGPSRTGPLLKPDLAAPGYRITSARYGAGNTASTLSGTSMAAPHVAGAMALLRQLHPTWRVDELKALAMNTAMPAVRTGAFVTSTVYGPGRVGAGRLDLSAAAVAEVVAYNADEPGTVSVSFGAPEVVGSAKLARNVRIINKGVAPATYTLSYSPRTDIPGVDFSLPGGNVINLPAGGATTFSVVMDATSSQMKHTRDVLVPDNQGFPRHWLSEESGLLYLWPTATSLAAKLSGAGVVPPSGSQASGEVTFAYTPATRQLNYTISVVNLAPAEITSVAILRGLPGASSSAVAYPLYQGNGTLGPGAPVQGSVQLSVADETLLAAGYLQVTLFSTTFAGGELRGQVRADRPILKLPLYAAPRPASVMHAANLPLDFGTEAQAVGSIALAGMSLSGNNYPIDLLSLVSAFELRLRSPNDKPVDVLRPEPDIFDHADIKYLGIANDLPAAGSVDKAMISFGLVTHASWASPREVEFNIFIDVDEDGISDYRLYNSDRRGYASRYEVSDTFITALEDLKTGQKSAQEFLNGLSAQSYDTAIFNSDVIVLPIRTSALGLTNSNSSFNYFVETESVESVGVVDRTPVQGYDLTTVGLGTSGNRQGAPVYDDLPGKTIPVVFDREKANKLGVDTVLLLHHHNSSGDRAELATVKSGNPASIYLPLIQR
jgi:subtilisin family serine protease